jgi:hypothetical protein
MANSITSGELKALLENEPETVLLDVRRRADYETESKRISPNGQMKSPRIGRS